MSIETDLRDLMERTAAADLDLAERLRGATRANPNAEVDGVANGYLSTVDLLRVRGRLDGLRDAVLALARELDQLKQPPS